MATVGIGEEFTSLLTLTWGIVQMGIVFSTLGTAVYWAATWFSQRTRTEEPDPTIYKRQFEKFFDTSFAPIGQAVANRTQSPPVRQLSFQVSIGIAVVFASTVFYLITAGVITGAVLATHQAFGIVVDPTSLFRIIIAFVVVCALAVMFNAECRAKQLSNQVENR